jgi:hypothetical protein
METVSLNALVKRINRCLAGDDEQLHKARGQRTRLELGEYYVVNFKRNFVVAQNVDPETLARELGVL